jgi:uncharacterized ferritin-like protein (DUF455 family)
MRALIELAGGCLQEQDPVRKVARTRQVAGLFRQQGGSGAAPRHALALPPGRPERPRLVHFSRLAQRRLTTAEGRAAFLHALAHIEFNAINLAWDAVCRFPGLPVRFYLDWSRVAEEEAGHFTLLAGRLQECGYAYGDFPAHDGLWEMAEKTARDPLERMALVPRVLEARGLDVTPGMLARLEAIGDTRSMRILQRILDDEIGHVRIGSRWFGYLCKQRGLDPAHTFMQLLAAFGMTRIRQPLNLPARREAGFAPRELDMLNRLAGTRV